MFDISLANLAIGLPILLLIGGISYRWRKSLYKACFSQFYRLFRRNVYDPAMDELKKDLFEDLHQTARKRVRSLKAIDISSGSGENFKYLPPSLDLTCFDPNGKHEASLRKNAGLYLSRGRVRVVNEPFGDLAQFADNSIDAVLCTLVLCSIKDQAKVLATTRRVLKPVSMRVTLVRDLC